MLPFPSAVTTMTAAMAAVPTLAIAAGQFFTITQCWGRRGCRVFIIGQATLDDLIELSPIEPDASTFRAEINFNSLSFAHHEIDSAMWAWQARRSIIFHDHIP